MAIVINNYSKLITDDELLNCLNLIPEFKTLKTKIFIVDSPSQYLFYCLKHFRIYSLLSQLFNLMMNKLTSNDDVAYFNYLTNTIYINTTIATDIIDNKLNRFYNSEAYKDNIIKFGEVDYNKHKTNWAKFIILDFIIHELCHSMQQKDNRLTILITLKNAFTSWDKRDFEIDAVSSTISIFERFEEDFHDILNVYGIEISHSLTPLHIDYKLYANVEDMYDD